MALFDSEVACQSATATDRGYLRPGPGEQCRVGAPAQHRGVVAVRLSQELETAQIGRAPAVRPLQQLGEGEDTCGNLGHTPVVKQVMSVAAPDREAGRLQSHNGRPRRDVWV